MDMGAILSILDATLRLSTPLLLACLAGLYSERAGIFDIGLEGKMLAAAFAAAAVAAVSGSAWIGLMAGMAVSVMTACLQGVAAITLKGNLLIAGVAINMLAAGLTTFLGQQWFHQGGNELQYVISGLDRTVVVIIQALVILFTGAMEGLFRPGLQRGFALFSQESRAEALERSTVKSES